MAFFAFVKSVTKFWHFFRGDVLYMSRLVKDYKKNLRERQVLWVVCGFSEYGWELVGVSDVNEWKVLLITRSDFHFCWYSAWPSSWTYYSVIDRAVNMTKVCRRVNEVHNWSSGAVEIDIETQRMYLLPRSIIYMWDQNGTITLIKYLSKEDCKECNCMSY